MTNDKFWSDLREAARQEAWRDVRRDLILMTLCALVLGVLIGQVL